MANYTEDQLKALQGAIALGALEVEYADKKVTYRSIDDMIKTENIIKEDLGMISTGYSRINAIFSNGL